MFGVLGSKGPRKSNRFPRLASLYPLQKEVDVHDACSVRLRPRIRRQTCAIDPHRRPCRAGMAVHPVDPVLVPEGGALPPGVSAPYSAPFSLTLPPPVHRNGRDGSAGTVGARRGTSSSVGQVHPRYLRASRIRRWKHRCQTPPPPRPPPRGTLWRVPRLGPSLPLLISRT